MLIKTNPPLRNIACGVASDQISFAIHTLFVWDLVADSIEFQRFTPVHERKV